MADIFREVDEEVRREQAVQYWSKYGNYAVVVAVVVVLATAGWVGWKEYVKSQQQAEGARFEQATELLRNSKWEAAAKAYEELAGNSGGGYATLARLRAAAAWAETGDEQAAVAEFNRIAADSGTDPLLRQLADLLSALHTIDTAPPDELRRRLEPMAEKTGGWSYLARELLVAVMLREGDRQGAVEALKALSDDAIAPPGVRGRATELLAALNAGKP